MKKKVLIKTLCVAMVAFMNMPVTSFAEEVIIVQEEGENSILPCAEEIVWVVKEINGKKYRRLYNTTTGEYIGDWILCE